MEQLVERAYAAFGEEARRRAIDYRARPRARGRDRHRRRPRAADHLEPALERVPLDARGRPRRARAVGAERLGVGRRRGHRAGDHPRGARADLPAVLVARRRRDRSRSCDRARARGCSRRRDRGRQQAGPGSRFVLVLPALASLALRSSGRRPSASASSGLRLDAVGRRRRCRRSLEPLARSRVEPLVDAAPAAATRSTSSARSSTRACRSASRSPSSRSSRRISWFGEAAHLGEVARDRQHLGAQTVLDGVADAPGSVASSSRRRLGERLDLVARALERGVDAPDRCVRRRRARGADRASTASTSTAATLPWASDGR